MSIIKMSLSVSAAAAGVAQIDIPAKGVIRLLSMGMSLSDATPLTGEGATFELSFLSVATFTTNDARGSLCQIHYSPFHVAAAIIAMAGDPFCILTPIAVEVAAGERMFLHGLPVGSAVASCQAYIYVDDGIDVARAQVRRR